MSGTSSAEDTVVTLATGAAITCSAKGYATAGSPPGRVTPTSPR
ncbi:MAG TPA: hypothetical protein VIJ41_09935 [Candidatus Nanopelagicales bacterium]